MGALCLSLQHEYGNDYLLLAEPLTYMDFSVQNVSRIWQWVSAKVLHVKKKKFKSNITANMGLPHNVNVVINFFYFRKRGLIDIFIYLLGKSLNSF